MFIAGTEPSETSVRYAKLKDPSNITYSQNGTNLTLSWTSPGLPEAVDINYLTEYFKEGYTIWADEYLKKRLNYNAKNIGNFGFDVYAVNGTYSEYLGTTTDTSYTVNLSNLSGTFDGFIVKSAYSIFKSNASDGIKLLYLVNPQITDSDFSLTISPLEQTISVGSTYSTLTSNDVSSVRLRGVEVLNTISNLNVKVLSAHDSFSMPVDVSSITQAAGTYKIKYEVTFYYSTKRVTKTYTQTVNVN